MQINNEILNDFIHCQYKAYRKSRNQRGNISEYQLLCNELKQKQKANFEKSISENKNIISSKAVFDNISPNSGISLNLKFTNENIDLTLDGIEFIGKKNILPVFMTPFEKVTKTDKLFLALQATFIQNEFNLHIENCKIVSGINLKQTKFKFLSFAKPIKKLIGEMNKMLSNSNAPIFFRNSNCQVCEFQISCLEKLIEKDDLSLMTALKTKEILQKNNRGIFSVKQLSYTFRPKKNPYRSRKFLPELKALAIREAKTIIQELPKLKQVETEVYLDFEGILDRGSNYLIGVILKTNKVQTEYSFWANNEDQQTDIFIELIKLLKPLNSFTIYHYGSYEIQALKSISKKLSTEQQFFLKTMIDNSFNVLNIFSHNIYPPTYSNSLKEIAKFLKFEWSEKDASGLQSITWRYSWEISSNVELKRKLITYNLEDCKALEKIVKWVKNIEHQNVLNAKDLKNQYDYNFGNPNNLIADYEIINKYSYFDYQRNKIYLKTNKSVKKAIHRKEAIRKSANKIDQEITYTSSQCSYCGCKNLYSTKPSSKVVVDLKFMKHGIKKWVVNNISFNYICNDCKKSFVSKKILNVSMYGENIALWSIYQHIQYNLSLEKIIKMLQDMFHVSVSLTEMHAFKSMFVQKYSATYEEIKNMVIKGQLIHADETKASVRDLSTGYVWVFANMDSAFYMFKPNREADFLLDLLRDFKGVLITDFYAGYDAIQCPQQKCLLHLIRDINEDLLKNQLNQEFMNFAVNFGNLLRNILETVNKYGLKKRNLSKHRREVQNYFSKLSITEFDTELAISYQKRLLKNKDKLFTFIDYDGIPWNNNNAENAVKVFSYYRKLTKNRLKENGMSDYLVLLSILQTCKYRGLNFFEFLKSGKLSIFEFQDKRK